MSSSPMRTLPMFPSSGSVMHSLLCPLVRKAEAEQGVSTRSPGTRGWGQPVQACLQYLGACYNLCKVKTATMGAPSGPFTPPMGAQVCQSMDFESVISIQKYTDLNRRSCSCALSVPVFSGWESWATKKPRVPSKVTEPFFTQRP